MINPEIHTFLDRWSAEWSTLKTGASPADRRAHFEVIAKNMRLETPADVETDAIHWIDSPAGKVRVRIFRHCDGGQQPCLIYMHGGAWMQGSPETHWDITARFASWNRQTVISIDYAKAPEIPFPAAFKQCAAVTNWANEHADMLGIDPDHIALGGDSAGGNLAAAVCLAMRDTPTMISAQLLIYPACDFDQSRPSYKENADGPLLQVKGMDSVNAMYCPNPADLLDPRAAPLTAKDHSNLPPAFIATAEHDPLRDSGRAYADALEAAGVDVTRDQGQGLIHGYLRAMDFCTASQETLQKMAKWLATQNGLRR